MTNPTPTPMLPCPFCKSDANHIEQTSPIHFSVCCNSCGGQIHRITEAEAITAWNTRPEPLVDCVECGAALGLSNIRCVKCEATRPQSQGSDEALTPTASGDGSERPKPVMTAKRLDEIQVWFANYSGPSERQLVSELVSLATKLEAERDAAREALAWQPIETAPRDGTSVLLRVLNCLLPLHFEAYFYEGEWWTIKHSVTTENLPPELYDITHWQPLPPSPAQKEG